MLHLDGKKVGVTGPNSMVGRAVITELLKRNAVPYPIMHKDFDLTDPYEARTGINTYNPQTKRYSEDLDYLVHCAGYNGNISFNKKYPLDIFYGSTLMALYVLDACREAGIKKVVSPLSSCAYPDVDILRESEFWDGPPNETVEAHGLAKRNILAMTRMIAKQYPDFRYVSCIFNTCYGPHDSFYEAKTKVVGGMIKRFVEAVDKKEKVVTCWGTGNVRREFIYVDDAARGLVDTLVHYDDPTTPINIGSGADTSIKKLAETMASVCGFDGKIEWDTTKPDGQYRKLLVNDKMNELLPERKFTSLRNGLEKTVSWYRKNI